MRSNFTTLKIKNKQTRTLKSFLLCIVKYSFLLVIIQKKCNIIEIKDFLIILHAAYYKLLTLQCTSYHFQSRTKPLKSLFLCQVCTLHINVSLRFWVQISIRLKSSNLFICPVCFMEIYHPGLLEN